MLVSEGRPWFYIEIEPSKYYNLLYVTLAPPSLEKETQATKCYLIQSYLFPSTTLLIQVLSSINPCHASFQSLLYQVYITLQKFV